jgi:membrane-associated protein
MDHLHDLINGVLHLDRYLISLVTTCGLWTYVVIFAVIFCETGLVITPFLPGDSLLFALGSLAANVHHPINILLLLPLLIAASILGNLLNYSIGRTIGSRILLEKMPRFFSKRHLDEAHQFYEKHGGATIILARFIPIVRTFVPFVAGVSHMSGHLFLVYNVGSAVLWITSLLGFGYFLGSLPFIKENFSIVIYGIVVLSLLPALFTFIHHRIANTARINKGEL